MVKVVLYQLPLEANRKFRGSDCKAEPFDRTAYVKKYECERTDGYDQNSAFHEFNINQPEDYKNHSMSVSDIVSIDGKEYFCDSFGWCDVVDGELQGVEEE